MPAISVTVRSVTVPYGPNKPAIKISLGTKYECNLGSKGDQICLQCLRIFKYLQSDRVELKSYLKN